MKRFLLYLGFTIVFSLKLNAQDERLEQIVCLDGVPLVIHTGAYIDTLLTSDSLISFHLLSDRLKVTLLPQIKTAFNKYYNVGLPLTMEQLGSVEFRAIVNQTVTDKWSPVLLNQSSSKEVLLIDTLLKNGTLLLQFRFINSFHLIQQDLFGKANLTPNAIAVRNKPLSDASDILLLAKSIETQFDSLPGFHAAVKSMIVDPGNALEIVFSKPKLNIDSCLQYRLVETATNELIPWVKTGHFLSLRQLNPGSSYFLYVRYMGLSVESFYSITVTPYWYQTGLALTLLGLTAFLLLVFIPYFFYRYNFKREKFKRERIQDQLLIVQNRLHPHFIYNALSSIQGLINLNKINDANEYLTRFSDIMMGTLNNSGRLSVPLPEEIKMLENYLALEQLRFGFVYEILINDNLDIHSFEIPPMLVQPSVENAVKHGVAALASKGLIQLHFNAAENGFVLIIIDNGNGEKSFDSKEGNGILITKSRIENLKKISKETQISYSRIFDQTGCTVTFYFKNLTP